MARTRDSTPFPSWVAQFCDERQANPDLCVLLFGRTILPSCATPCPPSDINYCRTPAKLNEPSIKPKLLLSALPPALQDFHRTKSSSTSTLFINTTIKAPNNDEIIRWYVMHAFRLLLSPRVPVRRPHANRHFPTFFGFAKKKRGTFLPLWRSLVQLFCQRVVSHFLHFPVPFFLL